MKWVDQQKKLYEPAEAPAKELDAALKEDADMETIRLGEYEEREASWQKRKAVEQEAMHTAEVEETEEEERPVTVINARTVFSGDLESEENVVVAGSVVGNVCSNGDVCVFGSVQGDIICHDVILEHARVNGNIECLGTLSVSGDAILEGNVKAIDMESGGRIQGNVEVNRSVKLCKSGIVEGNITALELEAERGCTIKGTVMIIQKTE